MLVWVTNYLVHLFGYIISRFDFRDQRLPNVSLRLKLKLYGSYKVMSCYYIGLFVVIAFNSLQWRYIRQLLTTGI